MSIGNHSVRFTLTSFSGKNFLEGSPLALTIGGSGYGGRIGMEHATMASHVAHHLTTVPAQCILVMR